MNTTAEQVAAYLDRKAAQRLALADKAASGVDVPAGVMPQALAAAHRNAAEVLSDVARDVRERAALGVSL